MEDCIFIWDEAHNLPSRARDLMSDSVSTYSLDFAIKEAGKFNQDLEPEIVEIRNRLMKLSDKLGLKENEILIDRKDLI